MPNKSLIQVPLNELRTNDEEVIGSIYEHGGKKYKWVKNKGTTALVADACCLEVLTSVEAAAGLKVIAPSGAGASTGAVKIPAGVPVTAIQASGSNTGDHGYILIAGRKRINLLQMATALTPGMVAIATVTNDNAWLSDDVQVTGVRQALLMVPVATTGVATAVSAMCDIQCA